MMPVDLALTGMGTAAVRRRAGQRRLIEHPLVINHLRVQCVTHRADAPRTVGVVEHQAGDEIDGFDHARIAKLRIRQRDTPGTPACGRWFEFCDPYRRDDRRDS